MLQGFIGGPGSVPGRTTLVQTVRVLPDFATHQVPASVIPHLAPSSLALALPLSSRNCRCGRPLDCLGHHRSACAVAGVLGRRGFVVVSAIDRICREGGARVSMNVFVRDLDLGPFNHLDGRRMEVVADGLSLFGGAQLAIDTTLVSALRRDGTAREGAANRNGVAIRSAHRRKDRTYPVLAGAGRRARLVILAGEVGGRWSPETAHFLRALAVAKARDVPSILQASFEVAWFRRWSNILSCEAARAFADSLLEVRGAGGAGGDVPSSHDVVRDNRF